MTCHVKKASMALRVSSSVNAGTVPVVTGTAELASAQRAGWESSVVRRVRVDAMELTVPRYDNLF